MKQILLGNEAIAKGLIDAGCTILTSYPGTPASEILQTIFFLREKEDLQIHAEWSVNEKVAFEVALGGSYAGLRAAVSMKQVGLNVASDSLLSSAYTGVKGGFLVISADDPGPSSSQTEQDSRMFALFAKVPVLDPSTVYEAYLMTVRGIELSESFQIPFILRPTTKICHQRADVEIRKIPAVTRKADFVKEPSRWAATPAYRYLLHKELNAKLERISLLLDFSPTIIYGEKERKKRAVISSGYAASFLYDFLTDEGIDDVTIYKLDMPYPLNRKKIQDIVDFHDEIIVIEETYPLIEYQITDRRNVKGRLDGTVPSEGEIKEETVHALFSKRKSYNKLSTYGKKPTLCPGCPHRSSFYAIKEAFYDGIFPGDIGCYTLGINLGTVDTCLCMGASISIAAGISRAYKLSGRLDKTPIVAAIGDSTFYHSGITPLINAVKEKSTFLLAILDNSTTAMTGNQPTPAMQKIEIEDICKAAGVGYIRCVNPNNLKEMKKMLKEGWEEALKNETVSVVIAKFPCVMDKEHFAGYQKREIYIDDDCTGCRVCIDSFECPAILFDGSRAKAYIDEGICSKCGICADVCPIFAIKGDKF